MSIFLTETDIRHSLLHKQKLFRDKVQTRLTSNSSKLTGASREAAIDVEGESPRGGAEADVPILREEEDDEDVINMADIPPLDETAAAANPTNRRPKRRRSGMTSPHEQGEEADENSDDVDGIDTDSSADELFVGGGGGDESDTAIGQPPSKRRREKAAAVGDTEERDDKKKMAMDISYEGFAIYGRVLCLVVKRRGGGTKGGGTKGGGNPAVPSGSKSQTDRAGGQAMMENWIASTQLPEAEAAAGEADTL